MDLFCTDVLGHKELKHVLLFCCFSLFLLQILQQLNEIKRHWDYHCCSLNQMKAVYQDMNHNVTLCALTAAAMYKRRPLLVMSSLIVVFIHKSIMLHWIHSFKALFRPKGDTKSKLSFYRRHHTT